jgi:hypothetical protein
MDGFEASLLRLNNSLRMKLTRHLSRVTTSSPSKDELNYLHNDALPKDNNINPHLLYKSFLTIHYRFIQVDRDIHETKIFS